MDDYLKEVLRVVAQHGPWAMFCFYLAWQHFRLSGRTIEVLTAIRTLIENLECQRQGDNKDED